METETEYRPKRRIPHQVGPAQIANGSGTD